MGIVLSKPFSAATYIGKSNSVDVWSFKEGDDFRVKLDGNLSATPFAYLKITAASDPAKISDDTNFGGRTKVSVDTLTGKLSTPYAVIWNDNKTEGLEKLLVSVYADEKETVLLGKAYLWINDTSKNPINSGEITIKDGKPGAVGAILVAPPITGDSDASITFYQWFKDGTPLTLFSQAGNGPSASTLNTLNIGAGEYKVKITVQNSDGFTRDIDSSAPIKISKVENQSPTDLTTTAASLNENIAANSIVASLGTTDPDVGNTFAYALVPGTGSTDNAAFSISGNQLKINASPNFETKSSYSVRVRTTDQGRLTFEKNLTFSVNDLIEKVTSSASTVLAADKDILELTGSKNIFGTGNNRDNEITGNSGRNRITGGLGKDVLTGGLGSDTFFYATRNDSLLSRYDVITDYVTSETIACGFDVEGDSIIAPRGTIDSLVESSIKGLLTDTVFEANAVDAFKVVGISGCFVAINDSNNGFQSTTDTIIHLLNYDIGASSPVLVI